MPSFSFFIDGQDVALLLDRLNQDREIAFVIADERMETGRRELGFCIEDAALKAAVERPQKWKAVRTVDTLVDGSQSLWHVPGGPLPLVNVRNRPASMPLVGPSNSPLYPAIPDPWNGWTGTDQFGPACAPWIRLDLWTRHRPYTEQERSRLQVLNAFWAGTADMLVVSDLQWTGSHFRPAPPPTQRWWNRMKGWLDRNAIRLRRNPSFWAFPSALQKLKGGMRYYSRHYDLNENIRIAEIQGNTRSSEL
jgi:hypothetical protein